MKDSNDDNPCIRNSIVNHMSFDALAPISWTDVITSWCCLWRICQFGKSIEQNICVTNRLIFSSCDPIASYYALQQSPDHSRLPESENIQPYLAVILASKVSHRHDEAQRSFPPQSILHELLQAPNYTLVHVELNQGCIAAIGVIPKADLRFNQCVLSVR
jgi:hypothetical protein